MNLKKLLLFAGGFVLVIVGTTLVLRDWMFVQMVFRGVSGPALAVAGLIVLSMLKE